MSERHYTLKQHIFFTEKRQVHNFSHKRQQNCKQEMTANTAPQLVNIPSKSQTGDVDEDDDSIGGYDTNDSILLGEDDAASRGGVGAGGGDGTDSSLSVSSRDNYGSNGSSSGAGGGIAKRQNRTVQHLRMLLGSILVAVVGVSIVGFLHLQNTKKEQFETEFKAQASKVIDGFKSDKLSKLQSLEALSTSITNYAKDSNLTWPFVKISNSADYFEPYLALSDAASIVLMPIVGARQRIEWEEYSVEHSTWIDEDIQRNHDKMHEKSQGSTIYHHGDDHNENSGYDHQNRHRRMTEYYLTDEIKAMHPEQLDILDANAGTGAERHQQQHRKAQYFSEDEAMWDKSISTYIKNYVGLDVSPGPWIVWWQYAPVIQNRWFVNFNRLAYEHFADDSQAIMDGKAAVSRTQSFNPGLDFQSTRDFTFTNDLLTAGGNQDGYTPGEPIGYIYYPVFEDFHNKKVVSILMMTVYWKSYFRGKCFTFGMGVCLCDV